MCIKPRLFMVLLGIVGSNMVSASGDPRAGEAVFNQHCKICHSLQPDLNGVGPSLAGVLQRKAGMAPGYDYSPAMKKSDLVWNDENLKKFIADPQGVIPGNKMPFAGLSDKQARENLIAYLKQAADAPAAGGSGVAVSELVDIVRDPAEVPDAVGQRGPQTVKLTITAKEVDGRLADGTGYRYWTFNGKVPGPFLRVRVNDTVALSFENAADSMVNHSIDLHAVTGPGGGAAALELRPGERNTISFKALAPGLYVYHCATPVVAQHIANGMYGLILVEPEGGLPAVDREFYLMQGEIYTDAAYGTPGMLNFSADKLLNERAEYYVFNGAVDGLTAQHPLRAGVGDTVRIHFGVGGPNATSSFHVIGEILDRVYEWGGVINPPIEAVQTVSVPPGGAAIVDLTLDVPGQYIIVDHALSRLERGLAAYLIAEGKEKPAIFQSSE